MFHLGGIHRLELKNGAAAENGIVDIEIRIFGGGGNEGNGAILNVLQQRLLLLFIEILDLIQVQHHTAHGIKAA